MEQQPLFFEDIYDALRHVVQAAGGAKTVGAKLFVHKEPDQAGRILMDCLNAGRPEKLDPEQVVLLLRLGQETGCHSAVNYICTRAGYSQPEPITPGDEKAELQRQFIQTATTLRQLVNRLGLDPL